MAITRAEWGRVDRELALATTVLEELARRYGGRVRASVKHPSRALDARRGFWHFTLGLSLDPDTVAGPEHRYELVEARVWSVRGFFNRGYERRVVATYGVDELSSDEPLRGTAEAVVSAWPLRRRR
jgi:hypothetical protein